MKRKPSFMLLLVIALLALLPLLAVLQYRWLGQVSEGERERMENNLNASARQFCQDFDSELTAIYLHFQPAFISSQKPGGKAEDDFAAKYRRWRETAPHPKLVKAVYQTQAGAGEFGLTRFNDGTGAFEPCEWPDSLSKLRRKLDESRARRESLRLMLRESFEQKIDAGVGLGKMVVRLSLGSVDEDLPGLIIPISDDDEKDLLPLPSPRSYRIVALDAEAIKQELIPELARRHFGAGGGGEYNVAVVKRGRAEEVIYRSDGGVSETDIAGADAQAGLFKIRINEANRFFMTPLPPGGGSAAIETRQHVAISIARDIKVKDGGKDSGNAPALPPPQVRQIAEDVLQPALIHNGEGAWRLIVKHRAGSLEAAVTNTRRRNLAISFGVLLLLGASVGFIVLSSRRAERLATQQMEFVAGVSHELRTPLAVICSAAENLADGVIDNRDQIRRYGGLIRDEGRRLTGMVEQVLEFAGAQSGRKNYELRPAELSRIIEDAVTACHLQLAEGGFEVERKVAADLPMINADAAALSRAIQNLLSNAIKYSGDSRWIGLSAESATTANGDEVRIRVSDRGLGIAPSELGSIFEPFYRGKEAVAAQIRGNGLGLSLVRHIVESHGGRVIVESKLGKGSDFAVILPACVKEPACQIKEKRDGTSEIGYSDHHSDQPGLC